MFYENILIPSSVIIENSTDKQKNGGSAYKEQWEVWMLVELVSRAKK